jgi:hypothetical protein
MIARCMVALTVLASIPAGLAGKLEDPVAMFVLSSIPTNMSLINKDMLAFTSGHDAAHLVLSPKYGELSPANWVSGTRI